MTGSGRITLVVLNTGCEFVLAMRHNIGLGGVLRTIDVYPTHSEAAKYVAGRWRLNPAPQRLLRVSQRYLAWLRGG
ncbi:hypothetical protein [Paraburkholderia sp.]|uniref:hypothetical protein n=1 Tax=Paraburkholderia sp. TaxID=1926495 RepID=UPI0025D60179|nr:hypothetical protein [Paraburkholderia sp.]